MDPRMTNNASRQGEPPAPEGYPELNWKTEQLNILAEERRLFDRYMWQLPVASLGIIAILLNSANTLIGKGYVSSSAIMLILLVCVVVCIYSAFILARLRARRKIREQRIRQLECGIPDVSVVVSADDVCEFLRDSPSTVDRWFGHISTTKLGVVTLLLVGFALFVTCFFVPRRIAQLNNTQEPSKKSSTVVVPSDPQTGR